MMLSSVPGYDLLLHVTSITLEINISFKSKYEIVKTGSLVIIYLIN